MVCSFGGFGICDVPFPRCRVALIAGLASQAPDPAYVLKLASVRLSLVLETGLCGSRTLTHFLRPIQLWLTTDYPAIF